MLRSIFNFTIYTAQDLYQVVTNNDFEGVKKMTSSWSSPRKIEFDFIFQNHLATLPAFGINIQPEIFTHLKENGYFSFNTQLLYFCKNNKVEALRDLLENNHNSNEKDIFLRAGVGLRFAAQKGNLEIVEMLLSNFEGITAPNRATALVDLAICDTPEVLENKEPQIANMLLPDSLEKQNNKLCWSRVHALALLIAIEKRKLWLVEMLMLFPVSGILDELKKHFDLTPLSYELSLEPKDESILLFLIKQALNTDKFFIRFDEQKNENVFFEKTDDEKIEHVWDNNDLKVLFKAALQFPAQTDALLTRFSKIFRPIAEAILAKEKKEIFAKKKDFSIFSGTHVKYMKPIGEVFVKHGLLTKLPPKQYQSNTVEQEQMLESNTVEQESKNDRKRNYEKTGFQETGENKIKRIKYNDK